MDEQEFKKGVKSDVAKSEQAAQVAASQRNEGETSGALEEKPSPAQTKSNFENAVRILIDEAKANGLEAFDINAVLEVASNSLKTPEEQGIETTTEVKTESK